MKPKGPPRLLDVLPESLVDAPFDAPAVETQSALMAYEEALRSGGASRPERDLITNYAAESVRQDTGKPPGTPDDWPSGGYPEFRSVEPPPDGDRDGMPDEWEAGYQLDLQDAADASRDKDSDGYSNVEEMINGTDPG